MTYPTVSTWNKEYNYCRRRRYFSVSKQILLPCELLCWVLVCSL